MGGFPGMGGMDMEGMDDEDDEVDKKDNEHVHGANCNHGEDTKKSKIYSNLIKLFN